jgi:hypothetical protein
MVDLGATSIFISKRFVKKNHVITAPLERPIVLLNIDGSQNKAGTIQQYTDLYLSTGDRETKWKMLVTDTGPEDLVLGLPWLRHANPDIDWEKGEMRLRASEEAVEPPVHEVEIQKIAANRKQRRTLLVERVLENATDELWMCAGFTLSQQIAEKQAKEKGEQTFEQIVPKHYWRYKRVFSDEAAKRLPKHQPWDHAINFIPGVKPKWKAKLYPMAEPERESLYKSIDEWLDLGWIEPSKSPCPVPVFFIKKKNGQLCLIQDYQPINKVTIPDKTPLPLTNDVINRLTGAKWFTKLDIRWGYHNIRIREGDEEKAAFATPRGLFQPRVMFFGLTNSPATFQAFMNSIFAPLVAKGVVNVYLDDIIIFTKTLDHLREITLEVLAILEKYDLFLQPQKCKFKKQEIEYLGLII